MATSLQRQLRQIQIMKHSNIYTVSSPDQDLEVVDWKVVDVKDLINIGGNKRTRTIDGHHRTNSGEGGY